MISWASTLGSAVVLNLFSQTSSHQHHHWNHSFCQMGPVLTEGSWWGVSAHFHFTERLNSLWLASLLAISLFPSHSFSKLSSPREVISGFSSPSSASVPNYGKAKITESRAWPETWRGHSPLQALASRHNVKGDSARPGRRGWLTNSSVSILLFCRLCSVSHKS